MLTTKTLRRTESRTASRLHRWAPLACLTIGLALTVGSIGATPSGGDEVAPAPIAETIEPTVVAPGAVDRAPAAGAAWMIGGTPIDALIAGGSDFYRAGKCRIDTTLPAGYPHPTVPGAVEIKTYPTVRRAEVSGPRAPDLATNFAFFRLFEHIQKREISMTSPVEMDYVPAEDGSAAETGWTMSFLYRVPELGDAGDAGPVQVVDRPELTVLAIGFHGTYRARQVLDRIEQLEAWLSQLDGWERAGPPRGLYYNGPNVRGSLRWGEVQLPIQKVASEPSTESSTEPVAEPAQEERAPKPKPKKRVFLSS